MQVYLKQGINLSQVTNGVKKSEILVLNRVSTLRKSRDIFPKFKVLCVRLRGKSI